MQTKNNKNTVPCIELRFRGGLEPHLFADCSANCSALHIHGEKNCCMYRLVKTPNLFYTEWLQYASFDSALYHTDGEQALDRAHKVGLVRHYGVNVLIGEAGFLRDVLLAVLAEDDAVCV